MSNNLQETCLSKTFSSVLEYQKSPLIEDMPWHQMGTNHFFNQWIHIYDTNTRLSTSPDLTCVIEMMDVYSGQRRRNKK